MSDLRGKFITNPVNWPDVVGGTDPNFSLTDVLPLGEAFWFSNVAEFVPQKYVYKIGDGVTQLQSLPWRGVVTDQDETIYGDKTFDGLVNVPGGIILNPGEIETADIADNSITADKQLSSADAVIFDIVDVTPGDVIGGRIPIGETRTHSTSFQFFADVATVNASGVMNILLDVRNNWALIVDLSWRIDVNGATGSTQTFSFSASTRQDVIYTNVTCSKGDTLSIFGRSQFNQGAQTFTLHGVATSCGPGPVNGSAWYGEYMYMVRL